MTIYDDELSRSANGIKERGAVQLPFTALKIYIRAFTLSTSPSLRLLRQILRYITPGSTDLTTMLFGKDIFYCFQYIYRDWLLKEHWIWVWIPAVYTCCLLIFLGCDGRMEKRGSFYYIKFLLLKREEKWRKKLFSNSANVWYHGYIIWCFLYFK